MMMMKLLYNQSKFILIVQTQHLNILNIFRTSVNSRFKRNFISMDAFSKHKKLVNDYMLYYSQGKSLKEVFKRDT
jgi:hypothetical protein